MVMSVGLATTAQAQWAVTYLHPAGTTSSDANGVYGAEQVGGATLAGVSHAGRWLGSAASWVDLNPPQWPGGSFALCAISGRQAGYVITNLGMHAGIWNDTPDSWTDLHPATIATQSQVDQMDSDQLVGRIRDLFGHVHASLWSWNAASSVWEWHDLHPAVTGAADSVARGLFAGTQVGEAYFNDGTHASFWHGTAASWVDLSPPGTHDSFAYAAYAGRQVGHARAVGGQYHAGTWQGTAASWVDLHPPVSGALYSYGLDLNEDYQVGLVNIDGTERASLWSGTATSWEDLSLALTGSWGNTAAIRVWSDGAVLRIVGHGVNNLTGRTEALLWTRVLPCYANCDASTTVPALNVNDFVCFQSRFAGGDTYANCDGSTVSPVLNVNDFICFIGRFAGGCP